MRSAHVEVRVQKLRPHSTNFETEALLNALKQLLRERRIGYQAIADSLEVSLPTVKRMLNKPNLPLDRLFSICKIAEIEPVDIFSIAAKSRPKHTIITREQDDLFFEKPDFLTYFSKLIDEGMTPDEIADAENLTSASTQKYLSGLEKVGLIERGTGTNIRFLIQPPFGFGPDSRVLREQHVEFLQHTVAQVFAPDREEGVFAILKPLNLQSELYAEMVAELIALVDKYSYHSEHLGSLGHPDRKAWSLAIAAGPADPNQAASLKGPFKS